MTEIDQIPPNPENELEKEAPNTKNNVRVWVIIVIGLLLLALVATSVFFLFKAPALVTTQIRDVFIIFMALEFMVLGIALVILLVQLAKLVNLLQNDIKPILAATNETINTLKGTSEFLSANLVDPVIKLNGYMAGIKKALDLFKILRK
ncbi:MAG: hypothetical protein AB9897_08750 [Anaerolineaceae bacterium]